MSRRRPRTLDKAAGPAAQALARGNQWSDAQVGQAMRAAIAGGQTATPLPRLDPQVPFGPGMPMFPTPVNPIRPDSGRPEPRSWEYSPTFNLPGFGDRLIPWKVLRDAAEIPLIRRCIEIRKAEVATLDWDVTISAKAIERAQRQDPNAARSDIEKAMRERVEPHIGRLVDWWECPDRINGHDFIGWASKVLEEYFVTDGIPVYPIYSRGGDLIAFDVIDSTTIKPLIDQYGRRPSPPQAAFQQIVWGFPRGEFVATVDDQGNLPADSLVFPSDRMVYKVHNVRTFTPYGLSAVEQALSDVELYIRRMAWLKSEYTDGVMPAGWLLAGEGQAEWSPQMLLEYQRFLNDMLSGSTIARQRVQILPWGMKPEAERSDLGEKYKPDYDLHLIKLVSGHIDTTIAELGFTETGGLGSTGWHEGQADVQDRKATQPTLRRLQALCTFLQRRFLGAPPELEFRILGLDSEDEDAADEVASRRLMDGRMTWNEARDMTGLPRYTFAEADMPALVTQRGIVFLADASKVAPPGTMVGPAKPLPEGSPDPNADPNAPPGQKPPPDPDAVKAELVAYRRWLTKGRSTRPFRFEHITEADAAAAGVQLDKAEFAGGVAGRAPKALTWPGWERDLQVAEHWAPLLHQALTGAPSGPLKLAADWIADAPPVDDADLVDLAHKWLVHRGLPIAARITPILHGLWTDGFLVGSISARTVLAHHLIKAESTVTLAADWAHWSPGDEEAARELLGAEGFGDGLQALLDHGNVIIKGIEATKLDQLAAILATGVQHGDAPATIGQAIRALVDDPKWAYKVALTETTRAVSSATMLRYARNGVTGKEWMTAADQHVCVECGGNEDIGAILLDQAFPDGNDAPPAHPLCRCSISPAWLTAEEAAAAGGLSPLDLLGAPEAAIRSTIAHAPSLFDEPIAASRPGVTSGARRTVAAPAPEIRAVLQAARSTNAVEAVFNGEVRRITGKGLPLDNLEFKGSAQTAREHAEGILRGLERFPTANLQAIGTEVAQVESYADSGYAVINFGARYTAASARSEYLSMLRDGAGDWLVPGADNPVAVALHEFGHILDMSSLASRTEPDILAAVERRATAAKLKPETLIKREISQYATTNAHELAAEAFADVMLNGEAASGLSREIFDLLEAEYKTGRGFTGAARVETAAAAPADALAKQTVAQLRALAKDRGLTGYSKLTKPQLLERLRVAEPAVERPVPFPAAGERMTEAQAVARQAVLDEVRGRADIAAEIHELVNNGASERALLARITGREKLTGIRVPDLKALVNDPGALVRAVDDMADRAGLTRIGDMTGGPVPFDRKLMRPLEGDLNTGDLVRVFRSGYEALLPNGERILVDRATVAPATVEEIQAAAAERKAAERALARAAARERNQLLEARTKVGDLLAELDELVDKKAAANVFEERLTYAEQTGAVDKATATVLRKAVATEDPAKVRAALTRVASKNGLKPIGQAGKTAKYDPALHEPVGAVPAEGTTVRVVRRGMSTTVDGQDIQLTRARTTVPEAKPKPVPKPKPAPRATPVTRGTSATGYDARETAVRDLSAQAPTETRQLGGGAMAYTNLLSYPDGSKLVEKIYSRVQETKAAAQRSVDAERFGAQVLDAVGVRAPGVVQLGPGRLGMEWIDGEVGAGFADPFAMLPVEVSASDDAQLMGLADLLMANNDRNAGNWIRTADGHLAGIDHGSSFEHVRSTPGQAGFNPFASPFVERKASGAGRVWATNDMSPADMAVIRARLEALQPAFVQAKRLPWFNQMMSRFTEVEKRATGTRDRIVAAPEKVRAAPKVKTSAFADRQTVVRDLAQQERSDVRQISGGVQAQTSLVTVPDGRIIEKVFPARDAAYLKDSEELGAQVLDVTGVRAPAVASTGDTSVAMEYIEGSTGAEIAPEAVAQAIASDEGRLMGLADMIMANGDRNVGNWIRMPDGRLAGIDHGSVFMDGMYEGANGDFAAGQFTSWSSEHGRVWLENDISPADMAVVRSRLVALKPQFVRLDRTAWYDQMMARLTEVEKHAAGTRNRIAP